MTREEKLEAYLDHQYMFEYGSPDYIYGIRRGVEWADKNPKFTWISVEDRLPEEGEAIIEAYTMVIECQGAREEFEKIILSRYDGGFVCDGNITKLMGGTTSSVTHHWMPIPELPKKGE